MHCYEVRPFAQSRKKAFIALNPIKWDLLFKLHHASFSRYYMLSSDKTSFKQAPQFTCSFWAFSLSLCTISCRNFAFKHTFISHYTTAHTLQFWMIKIMTKFYQMYMSWSEFVQCWRGGSEKMRPFCGLQFMSRVEEWHPHISRVLTFLNVLIYTFPCLLWIVLEISHSNGTRCSVFQGHTMSSV